MRILVNDEHIQPQWQTPTRTLLTSMLNTQILIDKQTASKNTHTSSMINTHRFNDKHIQVQLYIHTNSILNTHNFNGKHRQDQR